jgi:hypothetical protein
MVLALLGDNPMQSEFACHIGLKGKLFCRACWVKGFDGLAESEEDEDVGSGVNSRQAETSDDAQEQESNGTGRGSNASSRAGSVAVSEESVGAGAESSKKKKKKSVRKKMTESMSNMVNRLKAFVKVSTGIWFCY